MSNEAFFSGHSDRGRLIVASCLSADYLAEKVVAEYNRQMQGKPSRGLTHLNSIDFAFTDGERNVRLKNNVRGADIYLMQALEDSTSGLTINDNYMSFLIAARAFREQGARLVTGILYYLAYGRQDKPTRYMREPVTVRLMADLAIEAGITQLVTWEPHRNPQAFYGKTKVDTLDSLNLFIDEFAPFRGREDVIAVAPDEGASKFVTDFADAMGFTYALAAKTRPEPGKAKINQIIGDFRNKEVAIILDDMISSAGSMRALTEKLVQDYGIKKVFIGASHNLCLPVAYENFKILHEKFNLEKVIVTDSIPQTEDFTNLSFFKVRSIADILARTINCIHFDESVSAFSYTPS